MKRNYAILSLMFVFGLMICITTASFLHGLYNISVINYVSAAIVLVFGVNIIHYEMRLK